MENGSLLHNGEVQSGTDAEKTYRKYYTLPTCRFTVIVRIIIAVDALASVILWLTGGDSKYFIKNIEHFNFLHSVFDLAIMAILKIPIFFFVYVNMESVSMKQIDSSDGINDEVTSVQTRQTSYQTFPQREVEYIQPASTSSSQKKNLYHFFSIFLNLAFLAYATVKGGLILNEFLNRSSYVPMHLTYNILTGCAVGFGLLELILSLSSFTAMRKLKEVRILHRLNEDGDEVDEEGNPKEKPANLGRLISLAKPEAGLLTIGIFCLFISSGTTMIAPLFFGYVIDAAQKSMEELNKTVVILLIIYIGGAIASMFRSWFFTLAGQRLVARLRTKLFLSIVKQEVAFFDVTRTGELTNRLASDTQVIQNAVTVNVSMLARYTLQIIGSLVVMFVVNASLTGVLLAVVPIISIAAVQYGKAVKKLQQKFQDRLADASTTAEEAISSIRTVRTFTSETKAGNHYGSDIDKSYKMGKKLAMVQAIFEGSIGMVSYGAISLVLWYGGKLVYEKIITPGQVTSFLLYTLQVALAFGVMSSLFGDFMKAVGASVRVFQLLDRKPKIPVEGGSTEDSLNGSIEFRNVNFTYPSRPETQVLKNVSFRVEPGQMVALVGPSGGGKSTMVNLIERFYDPDTGTILLGNIEVPSLDPHWFRQQLSMVSQEPTLFACSIKDNITYGKDASMDQIIDAAKQANAHDFIMTFEKGYETLVGERGIRLSGGQKQRVAIARALIMNPKILLLDEATSALDAESEHLVQEAIDRAMQNRTVVIIAHRLSTVRNASQVIVIDKGTIVEKGTHEELLAKDGVYKKLIIRQLTAGRTEGLIENEDREEKMTNSGNDEAALIDLQS